MNSIDVGILITNLGDSNWFVRGSAGEALAELAKHGAHSDPGSYADTHIESDDSRHIMLDSNHAVIAKLINNLGDSEWRVHGSAAEALVELAIHGAHSDAGAMQKLI
jgi:HEAT repeat protein